MAATLYQDANFGGPSARIAPGQRLVARGDPYAPGALVGYKGPMRGGNSYAEDLDNAVSSLRVDPGVVLTVSDSTSRSSSGGRTFVGPFEAADLAALGLDDRISAAEAHAIVTPATGAVGGPAPAAELYSDYGARGRRALLNVGDYSEARLRSDEVDFRAGSGVRSLRVAAGALAVLYAGSAFDASLDSVAIPGPAYVDDLDRYGMFDRVASVRVFATIAGQSPAPATTQRGAPAPRHPAGPRNASPEKVARIERELDALAARLARAEAGPRAPASGWAQKRGVKNEDPPRSRPSSLVLLLALLFIVVVVVALMRSTGAPWISKMQGGPISPGARA